MVTFRMSIDRDVSVTMKTFQWKCRNAGVQQTACSDMKAKPSEDCAEGCEHPAGLPRITAPASRVPHMGSDLSDNVLFLLSYESSFLSCYAHPGRLLPIEFAY